MKGNGCKSSRIIKKRMRVYYRFGWNSKRKICTWKHQRFCLIEQQAHAHAHLKLRRWKYIIETNSLKYFATHTHMHICLHSMPSSEHLGYELHETHHHSLYFFKTSHPTKMSYMYSLLSFLLQLQHIVWWGFYDRLTVLSTTMICPQNVNRIILN